MMIIVLIFVMVLCYVGIGDNRVSDHVCDGVCRW